MYDLNLTPIITHEGKMLSQLGGFFADGPPRRPVHSRSEDLLILSLILKEDAIISPEAQHAWLERLAAIFFKTSGSVTAALRSLVETLNLTMMEKNLQLAQNGHAATGSINLGAIHRRQLYIVQSGLAHAYVINHQGVQHFYDSSRSDRGLGLSRSPTIRYYQADVGTGAYLFMTDTPPETWKDDLLFLDGYPSFDQLKRRLLNQAPSNFRLDLAKITPGEGQINILQPPSTLTPADEDEALPADSLEPEEVTPSEEAPTLADEGDTREIKPQPDQQQRDIDEDGAEEEWPQDQPGADEDEDIIMDDSEVESPAEREVRETVEEQELPSPSRERAASPSISTIATASEKAASHRPQPAGKNHKASRKKKVRVPREHVRQRGLTALAAFFDKWRNARETLDTFFKDLLARWSPTSDDQAPRLSRRTMLFIAVAVPLVVVAVAVWVYLARGRTLQYQYYYEMAEAASISASSTDDIADAREEWLQTIEFLEQAEAFRDTEEIDSLRDEARDALDRLDGVVRLTYRPAIVGTQNTNLDITRVISFGPDLYLLDAVGGRVIHAMRTSQGYEIDPDFVCAAGNFSGGGVDALVDMASLPINNPYQAHLIAGDALGNVVYCAPGQDPVVQSLPGGDLNNNDIIRIVYANNSLYALNRGVDTIYVYPSSNGQFLEPPRDFFEGTEADVKPDMSRIVDLAVNGSELYLLRSDGLLDDCIASGLPGNPVNCEKPIEYVDGRPGKEDQALEMPESNYIGLLYTSPPDPSVSILDGTTGDIYRFSLRFRLYERLRPDLGNYELDSDEATAFTIGIDRFAFLAFGNQVFYAYIE